MQINCEKQEEGLHSWEFGEEQWSNVQRLYDKKKNHTQFNFQIDVLLIN